VILGAPFWHIVISCKDAHQFCYSLNGVKLEEGEMEQVGHLSSFVLSNFQERIVMQMGTNLLFIKTPEFSIEDKLEIGSSFAFTISQREILVLSQTQVLLWRHP
jgi:hypothetical protein